MYNLSRSWDSGIGLVVQSGTLFRRSSTLVLLGRAIVWAFLVGLAMSTPCIPVISHVFGVWYGFSDHFKALQLEELEVSIGLCNWNRLVAALVEPLRRTE